MGELLSPGRSKGSFRGLGRLAAAQVCGVPLAAMETPLTRAKNLMKRGLGRNGPGNRPPMGVVRGGIPGISYE